jgi:large subunit ribosomal protein L18
MIRKMARKNKRTIPYRRRREGKTNYKRRLTLLKSRKPKLVIRKFNKNIIAQIIEYHPEGDKVIASSSSNELKKYGWPFSKSNIPASCLVGLMIAKKAKGKEAILDLGLQSPIKGGKLYAALKGAIDGGLNVKADESIFPSKERIEGKHISDYAKSLSEEEFKKQFSLNIKNKADVKNFEKVFKEIKEKIIKG